MFALLYLILLREVVCMGKLNYFHWETQLTESMEVESCSIVYSPGKLLP